MTECYVILNIKLVLLDKKTRKGSPPGENFKKWAKDFNDPSAKVEYAVPDFQMG